MNIEYIAMHIATANLVFVNRRLRALRHDGRSCRFLNGRSDGITKTPPVCVDMETSLPQFLLQKDSACNVSFNSLVPHRIEIVDHSKSFKSNKK
jgi:hypothetical protein